MVLCNIVGSMFSVWPPTGDGWTCNQWIEALTKIQQRALDLNYPPILFGLDSVHGANFIFDATIFPHVRHNSPLSNH